jgi:hypothetical protein
MARVRGREWLRRAVAGCFALLAVAAAAAEHPFLAVRTSEYAELQALATRSPWREIRTVALNTSNNTTINPAAGIRDRAFNLNKIMEATALAYVIDPANRDRYRDRFYTYLKYWDLEQPGNLTKDLSDSSWDGSVPTGAAFFYTVLAMDIVHADPGTTPAQAAQRDGFIALMDRPGGPGAMGPGRYFDETPFEFHLMAHRAAKGIWALWKGDTAKLASAVADYRRAWMDFITDDGVYREYTGYGLSRTGEPSRSHKHFFADVLVHTGVEPGWYAQPKLQKFYEWLGGYAVMPNRWTWPIGDSSYTPYTGGYNSNFDRSERYSALAGRYGQWAKNGGLGANTLFPYLLTPRTNAPAPLEAPSRIFRDGGAWLKQPGGGREALAAVLVNQSYTPTTGLGHIHKEQNSLHLAGLGEILLRGSGYNGWASNDPINAGFSFAYTNNHAVSSNVAMFDYAIGNEKDTSFTNDHRKLGGLGVDGLLAGELDYAVGDTGPGGTPQSAIPNGRHVRHVVAVYPQDGVGGYVHCLDELAGSATTTNGHLVWHPHSDTITVNADNASDAEYEWRIRPNANTTDSLHFSLYLPTAPSRQQQYDGLFGEDISGNRPFRTFVGRYVFLTYALDPATRRRNVLSAFFPRKSTQSKPVMERIGATVVGDAAAPMSRAAVLAFPNDVRDFAVESDGLAERRIASASADPLGAVARAKLAVYRKVGPVGAASLAFYFAAEARSFREVPTGPARGFTSEGNVTLHVRGSQGTVVSAGTVITFYQPGNFRVRLNGEPATALAAGEGFVRLALPAGTHRLQFEPVAGPPTLVLQPADRVVAPGAPLLLQVSATGGAMSYQWFRDGVPLPGETAGTLYRSAATAADAGSYAVRVANDLGGTMSVAASVVVANDAPRAMNLSCRSALGVGEVLIPGFYVAGSGTKALLIRAVGPGLVPFGVTGALPDPRLRVWAGTTEVVANDDWQPGLVAEASLRLGAFPLPEGSKDAALLVTVAAGASYTVHVTGSGSGPVLLELYDADPVDIPASARIENLSVRGRAGTGDAALIVGLVVAGRGQRPFLLRGGGPALSALGVGNALPDPRLILFDASRRQLLQNDDWERSAHLGALENVRQRVGAFPYPANSRDAAELAMLGAGAYTLQVAAADEREGEVLAEIYASP